MMDQIDREGLGALATELMPRYVGATTLATRPAVVAEVRRLIESHPRETVKAGARALMNRPDSTPLLSGITAPTLIIVGEEDLLTPPVESERMHAAIAGSRLVTIPGAGHITNMETPEAFNQAVTAFLGSVRR
jgi:3-oxoadipate enol-lactonase